jgi:hypothetical protein
MARPFSWGGSASTPAELRQNCGVLGRPAVNHVTSQSITHERSHSHERKRDPGSAEERSGFPRHCGGRFTTATMAAGFQAAESGSARAITSVTGPKVAPPRSRTSPCSVAGTTGRSTRRATTSIEGRTARFTSGGRRAGPCPTSRVRASCPPTPCSSSEHGTRPRGMSCTRRPRPRAGLGSVWTSGGRSTSCIHEAVDRADRLGQAGASTEDLVSRPAADRLCGQPERAQRTAVGEVDGHGDRQAWRAAPRLSVRA